MAIGATHTDRPRLRSLSLLAGSGRIRLMPALPLLVLGLMVLGGIFAPLLTPYSPVANDLGSTVLPPGSPGHLLGTDTFGRDVLTRLLYGARVSFLVAGLALLIAVVLGTTVGVVAGYAGGRTDSILMRLVDMVLAMPSIILALAIAVAFGPSFRNLVLILGFLNWPQIARLIRGETLHLKNRDFVRYARAIGVARRPILRRHVFPNILPTLLVATTLEVGNVVLAEASLSFLGAGLPPPTPSWGVMVNDGGALIATAWWIALIPGIAITLAVLSFNALGDWLRNHWDPRMVED